MPDESHSSSAQGKATLLDGNPDIAFIAEGNPESNNSFSGISQRLIHQLRRGGATVSGFDADLYGAPKAIAAASTIAQDRYRWWVRYHLNSIPYRLRSMRAARLSGNSTKPFDFTFQIGATFAPPPGRPFVLYCDSNIVVAERGREFSEARGLNSGELQKVRRREAELYKRAKLIFTMSEYTRESFISEFGVSPDRVLAVYAGPNLDTEPSHNEKQSHGPQEILFVGAQHYRKGLDTLLAAFSELRETRPELRLTVIGPRDLPSSLGPGATNLGFLSKANEEHRNLINECYARATVFCLPSRFEPFGVAFLEAMQFGLPCVASDAWAMPEIIENGQTGLLCAPNNSASLRDALAAVLADPARARAMGERGRQRVRDKFSWARSGERVCVALNKHRSELWAPRQATGSQ